MIEVRLIFQTETPLGACFTDEEVSGSVRNREAGPLFGGAAKPREFWLPLSKIEIEGDRRRGAVVKVTLPERLAIEKGLA